MKIVQVTEYQNLMLSAYEKNRVQNITDKILYMENYLQMFIGTDYQEKFVDIWVTEMKSDIIKKIAQKLGSLNERVDK